MSSDAAQASPLSRTALKAQRLKPAPGREPVKRVWSRKRRDHIELFDPRQCIPMRAKQEPSAAQLAALGARRRKITHADCAVCGSSVERCFLNHGLCPVCEKSALEAEHQARDEARIAALAKLVACAPTGRTVYLDIETTGLYPMSGNEQLKVAAIDDAGTVLFDSLVKPERCTEWPDAQAIHGITPEDVAGAPPFAHLLPLLATNIERADALVIYNADFDLVFLPPSLRPLAAQTAICAMSLCGPASGMSAGKRTAGAPCLRRLSRLDTSGTVVRIKRVLTRWQYVAFGIGCVPRQTASMH